MSVIYGVVSTLVNLCNAYDKQEIIPEMIELAKFAKRHIPEQHELDDPDFVTKRVNVIKLFLFKIGLNWFFILFFRFFVKKVLQLVLLLFVKQRAKIARNLLPGRIF